ncbi:MAG: nickel pincer cofactor biosynthesis protein LarC [Planctomycetota bacterium]|jgi:uncharacterized protein (TIGR00299 family) protein|nr:nickel pincer cofactor biosynthesis protein LarC [Planctomycetota bacterium]
MHLHLDCQFGVAGDMFLGALVDAGADFEAIQGALREIIPDAFDISFRRVSRNGVAATLADVTWEQGDSAAAGDHHSHADEGPHRRLRDLLALLGGDTVPPRARMRAEKVFRLLGEAEAAVHGLDPEEVHFHEISGIDTAVDVIGSCLALEMLDVDGISASPLTVGSGMVICAHGIFPVPAPAVLEILRRSNMPWRSGGDGERATPTGTALLAGLADSFGSSPALTVIRIGYGAGHREFSDVPNLLRAVIGKSASRGDAAMDGGERHAHTVIARSLEAEETGQPLLPGEKAPENDRVVEFVFVVDDMTPEAVAHCCETCLAVGALDAWAIPTVMKKGRPGHEVTVLAAPGRAGQVADAIWQESTTFGMRVGERSRLTLARDFRTVEVFGQPIRIKLGWLGGKLIRRQPEYADCLAAAKVAEAPLLRIFTLAAEAAEKISGEV